MSRPTASGIGNGSKETRNTSASKMAGCYSRFRAVLSPWTDGCRHPEGCSIEAPGTLLTLKCIVSSKSSRQRICAMLTRNPIVMFLAPEFSCPFHTKLHIIDIVVPNRPQAPLVQFSFHRCPQLVHYRRNAASAIACRIHKHQTLDEAHTL